MKKVKEKWLWFKSKKFRSPACERLAKELGWSNCDEAYGLTDTLLRHCSQVINGIKFPYVKVNLRKVAYDSKTGNPYLRHVSYDRLARYIKQLEKDGYIFLMRGNEQVGCSKLIVEPKLIQLILSFDVEVEPDVSEQGVVMPSDVYRSKVNEEPSVYQSFVPNKNSSEFKALRLIEKLNRRIKKTAYGVVAPVFTNSIGQPVRKRYALTHQFKENTHKEFQKLGVFRSVQWSAVAQMDADGWIMWNEAELYSQFERYNIQSLDDRKLIRKRLAQLDTLFTLERDYLDKGRIHSNGLFLERVFKAGVYVPEGSLRCYTNRCASGGRLYFKVQSVPSWCRQLITIDDEPTVELDIKCSQLRVLFGIEGKELGDDVYERMLPGRRELAKQVALYLVGSETAPTRAKFNFNHSPLSTADWNNAKRALSPVWHHFGKGAWMQAQLKESEWLLAFLNEFLDTTGYVPFTVHDSVRVKESDAVLCEQLMLKHWSSIVGNKCVVSKS